MIQVLRATTTRTAYNICHPDIPLQADDPRYINLADARGGQNFAEELAQQIDWSQDIAPPYYQRLFTGHRGCGKTTELLLLQKKLQRLAFFVIYVDVEEMLDLDDIEYFDLLLGMMNALFAQANQAGLTLSALLLKAIYDWFKERVTTENEQIELENELKTEASGGLDIPFISKFFASLTAKIKVGSSQKIEIRQILKRDLSVFIDRLNALIKEVRKQAKANEFRDIVLIIDGLEKMPFDMKDGKSSHESLFVDNAERLKAPECHLIYTVPISLAYNANLNDAFGNDYVAVMPMVKLSSENCKLFNQLIEKRIQIDAVFESPELTNELIALSGGAVRDLMRLIRVACQGSTRINTKDVERAKRMLMLEYDRLLREEDFLVLQQVYQTKQVTADEKYGRLLHWRILHEYLNGKRWADVHPLVLAIGRVREKLQIAS
ncbi:hypothetical protein [Beggiatoa leptomitoformis]|uniref:AAA family ATPase n=1 Tax=Beggiatoa leptomitoformis TaxID=288004 RepID=A0A2N9YD79_9GAMM|nr:hypothetical protein [Beggiatoa leptomitoformis]ALG69152.1 hypothetical protein AL038_17495 [Beggiatoa leptomitoformis]AUI68427.1 hypothetical protein BLE401_06725 [Beggiatoa leptomitoformis]